MLGRWSYFPNSGQGCDTGASLGPVCSLWIRKTTRRVTAPGHRWEGARAAEARLIGAGARDLAATTEIVRCPRLGPSPPLAAALSFSDWEPEAAAAAPDSLPPQDRRPGGPRALVASCPIAGTRGARGRHHSAIPYRAG